MLHNVNNMLAELATNEAANGSMLTEMENGSFTDRTWRTEAHIDLNFKVQNNLEQFHYNFTS